MGEYEIIHALEKIKQSMEKAEKYDELTTVLFLLGLDYRIKEKPYEGLLDSHNIRTGFEPVLEIFNNKGDIVFSATVVRQDATDYIIEHISGGK